MPFTREQASTGLRIALEKARAARDLGFNMLQVRGLAEQARSALEEGDYETSLRRSNDILGVLNSVRPITNEDARENRSPPYRSIDGGNKQVFVESHNLPARPVGPGNKGGEWGSAIAIFVFLVLLGIAFMIPTATQNYGFGVTVTYQPYAYIGWTLIGISWLVLLWPWYKHIYTTMPKAYGQAIGEGISRGLRKGKVCPECNTINDIEAKFCPECGFSWRRRNALS
jgi:Uncharacterised protein family UPF0547